MNRLFLQHIHKSCLPAKVFQIISIPILSAAENVSSNTLYTKFASDIENYKHCIFDFQLQTLSRSNSSQTNTESFKQLSDKHWVVQTALRLLQTLSRSNSSQAIANTESFKQLPDYSFQSASPVDLLALMCCISNSASVFYLSLL